MNLLHEKLSDDILRIFYKVYNALGYGFLEKVYANAMLFELCRKGLKVVKQQQIKVHYKGIEVGEYFADLVVDDKIIIELKAAEGIVEEHEQQLLNYLKATDVEVGLLLNFGKTPQFKRRIFTNDNKIKR